VEVIITGTYFRPCPGRLFIGEGHYPYRHRSPKVLSGKGYNLVANNVVSVANNVGLSAATFSYYFE